jgi:hypothetical protein
MDVVEKISTTPTDETHSHQASRDQERTVRKFHRHHRLLRRPSRPDAIEG